jgi:hypothetical protein
MTVPFPSASVYPSASSYPDIIPFGIDILIWNPECIGNGRMLVLCDVSSASSTVSSIDWRINTGEWVTAASNVESPSSLSFWVYGYSPLPGTDPNPIWETDGSVFVSESEREVVEFTHNGERVPQAASLFDVDNTPNRWYWEDGVTYYNPNSGNVSPYDVPITTPAFSEGVRYRLEIRVNGFTVLDEQFVWHWPVRDTVGHIIDIAAPAFLAETQAARDIYFAHGRAIGDIYSAFDDYFFQSYPSLATWSIPIWESLLGLPSIVSLSLSERRSLVEETARGNGGFRAEFMRAIERQVGSMPLISDNYANYSTLIRLPLSGTDPDSAKYRAAAESVIERIKPSGISVSVSYATFISGVSKAGDAL